MRQLHRDIAAHTGPDKDDSTKKRSCSPRACDAGMHPRSAAMSQRQQDIARYRGPCGSGDATASRFAGRGLRNLPRLPPGRAPGCICFSEGGNQETYKTPAWPGTRLYLHLPPKPTSRASICSQNPARLASVPRTRSSNEGAWQAAAYEEHASAQVCGPLPGKSTTNL